MKSKMIVVGSLMILALMTMVSQADTAQAGTSVHVGFDLGGVYMPVDVLPSACTLSAAAGLLRRGPMVSEASASSEGMVPPPWASSGVLQ